MTITLTPETAVRLREQAQQSGQDVDSFADLLLADALTQNVLEPDPDDLADADIAKIRAGIGRGLEAAAAGRVKTLAQAVTEARQRHGFPATWASGIDGA